jgi:hypothetical protein
MSRFGNERWKTGAGPGGFLGSVLLRARLAVAGAWSGAWLRGGVAVSTPGELGWLRLFSLFAVAILA